MCSAVVVWCGGNGMCFQAHPSVTLFWFLLVYLAIVEVVHPTGGWRKENNRKKTQSTNTQLLIKAASSNIVFTAGLVKTFNTCFSFFLNNKNIKKINKMHYPLYRYRVYVHYFYSNTLLFQIDFHVRWECKYFNFNKF